MRHSLLNRIVWLQAFTVLLVLLPMVGAGLYVWTLHQRVQTHLADQEPRYARLAGLLLRKADLQALGVQVSEQMTRQTYPTAQDITQAGNDAQQRIRTVFADSKLDIISIQVLPPKEEARFDRIQINLRVEGELSGIQDALAKLATQTPVVLVDSVTLQTIGAVKPASIQRLGGQFNFSILRARS
ncbi:MAG: type II secretion system protein GspM [Rhodoferax sp.]